MRVTVRKEASFSGTEYGVYYSSASQSKYKYKDSTLGNFFSNIKLGQTYINFFGPDLDQAEIKIKVNDKVYIFYQSYTTWTCNSIVFDKPGQYDIYFLN